MEIITCNSTVVPHDLDFSGIHYYTSSYRDRKEYVIVLGGEKTITEYGMDIDGDEDIYSKEVSEVIGMVSLEQSPFEENIVWLNFIEVHPDHQGNGIAKELVKTVSTVMKEKFPGKVLHRSRVSEFCPKHMTAKFDEWYAELGVNWSQDRDGILITKFFGGK